jgi:hypothetical protein
LLFGADGSVAEAYGVAADDVAVAQEQHFTLGFVDDDEVGGENGGWLCCRCAASV